MGHHLVLCLEFQNKMEVTMDGLSGLLQIKVLGIEIRSREALALFMLRSRYFGHFFYWSREERW